MRTAVLVAALAALPVHAQSDQDEQSNWGVKPNSNWGVKPNSNWGVKPDVAPTATQPAPARAPGATRQAEVTPAVRFAPGRKLKEHPKDAPEESPGRETTAPGKTGPSAVLPGNGPGWTKLRGEQGWKDSNGNIWKKDRLHGDHWDISDSKGKKVREVDFEGKQIWPGGPKNKNKKP